MIRLCHSTAKKTIKYHNNSPRLDICLEYNLLCIIASHRYIFRYHQIVIYLPQFFSCCFAFAGHRSPCSILEVFEILFPFICIRSAAQHAAAAASTVHWKIRIILQTNLFFFTFSVPRAVYNVQGYTVHKPSVNVSYHGVKLLNSRNSLPKLKYSLRVIRLQKIT